MIAPNLEVVIEPNRLSVRNLNSGQFASVDAPFSCSHLLVDDVDILEHACGRAMKRVARGFWLFPRITVSTAGRAIHNIEVKIIRDAFTNAGASRVVLDQSVRRLDEQRQPRSAYLEAAKLKR